MRGLEDKVALVTGGGGGLGAAAAQRLSAEGAEVIISDLEPELGAATATEYGFGFLEQDVRDERRWSEAIEQIEADYGRLDVLVNNAGILGSVVAVSPQDTTLESWRETFAVNVEGVLLGCRAAIPALQRAGGGSIVNLSSVAGLLATPYATAYGASKATVRQLTKTVAQHCAEQRTAIRCNSVHPGNVITPLWERQAAEQAELRGTTTEEVIAEAAALVPLGGFTAREDVAAAIAFLASDDARHITGTALIVDGGIVNCDTYGFFEASNTRGGSNDRRRP